MASPVFIESQPPFTHPFSVCYDTVKQRTPKFGDHGEDAEGFVTLDSSVMADMGRVICGGDLCWRGYRSGFACIYHPLRDYYGRFKYNHMNDIMREDINTKYVGGPKKYNTPYLLKRLEIFDANGHEFLKLVVFYVYDSAGNALASSEGYGGNLILWLKKRQGEQAMQLTDDERARLRAFDNDFSKA